MLQRVRILGSSGIFSRISTKAQERRQGGLRMATIWENESPIKHQTSPISNYWNTLEKNLYNWNLMNDKTMHSQEQNKICFSHSIYCSAYLSLFNSFELFGIDIIFTWSKFKKHKNVQ